MPNFTPFCFISKKMYRIQMKWWLFLLSLHLSIHLHFNSSLVFGNHDGFKKTYIVHMDKLAMPTTFTNHVEWYSSLVQSSSVSPEDHNEEDKRLIYIYQSAFHGMAVRLTNQEAQNLKSQNGVVTVLPETKYELQTTRSPMFLGLDPQGTIRSTGLNESTQNDVVVGVLDTGIWPESESFNDIGFTSIPTHWKGACEVGRGFEKHHCNKKIVGARAFYKGYEAANGNINENTEYKSPKDQDGHGTHTAATVAGSPVHSANLFGFANGTARGMSPGARIAVYKVCWSGGCFSSDIISAVDQAIQDGVSTLSISLGGGVSSYFHDSLSIAAFGAMEKGIFVSTAAGNAGPVSNSVTNVSPWIMTVGASTMDRDFPGSVKLGNGKILPAVSLYKGKRHLSINTYYSLVYTGGNLTNPDPSSLCMEGTLDRHLVAGKIVICDRGVNARVEKGQVVKDAGGIGMILCNGESNGEDMVADSHLLPAVAVGEETGMKIKVYALDQPSPTATLSFFKTKTGIKPSPVVAAFSSRGPNPISPEILKPDVVAPGVNILAAWTGEMGPSGLEFDKRRVKFNILSGTSMSCPHVSGVAALLKARHPDWSPAAMKSALMTTAYIHDNTFHLFTDSSTGGVSGVYDHGAGHINPPRADDPGLIYDIGGQEYFDFLCASGLTQSELKVFAKFSNRICRNSVLNPGDLNYPALVAVFPQDEPVVVVTLLRSVTNVGPAGSKYHVRVSKFEGVNVKVEPKVLNFKEEHEKLSYKVTFTRKSIGTTPESGGLIWNDGVHRVRSPIVII